MPKLSYLNPLHVRETLADIRRALAGEQPTVDSAASPAESISTAAEETEGRSRDERAEVLQEEAEQVEETERATGADAEDAEELRQATERARTERRAIERDG